MFSWFLKHRTAAKEGCFVQFTGEIMFPVGKFFWIDVENGQGHPAAYVNPNSVGNNCIFCSQYTTNGQTIAMMCIGHQRTGNSNRQSGCCVHLMQSTLLNSFGTKY